MMPIAPFAGYAAQGIGYGFAAAAQPGAFQTFVISQRLSYGWRRTMPAALAPLISDGPIIVLMVVILSRLPEWGRGCSTLQADVHPVPPRRDAGVAQFPR
jgi:hypothetical protein